MEPRDEPLKNEVAYPCSAKRLGMASMRESACGIRTNEVR